MKKLFFLILILLQGLGANCQTPAALTTPSPDQTAKQTVHRKGFSIEPLAGLGTSEVVQNGTNNLGWKAGCGVVYMFNEHWGISSGLQVQRYSTTVVTKKDSEYIFEVNPPSYWGVINVNTIYNFMYIELPVMVRYLSNKNDKVGIFAETGFIFGYLITGNEQGTIYETDIDSSRISPTGYISNYSSSYKDISPNTTSFNFQLHLALGLLIPVTQRCSIIADFAINKGFISDGNSSKDILNSGSIVFNTGPNPIYYYNKNIFSHSSSNYGTNFSVLFSVRLNIKLDSKSLHDIGSFFWNK